MTLAADVNRGLLLRWEREGGMASLALSCFWLLSATFVAGSGQKESWRAGGPS